MHKISFFRLSVVCCFSEYPCHVGSVTISFMEDHKFLVQICSWGSRSCWMYDVNNLWLLLLFLFLRGRLQKPVKGNGKTWSFIWETSCLIDRMLSTFFVHYVFSRTSFLSSFFLVSSEAPQHAEAISVTSHRFALGNLTYFLHAIRGMLADVHFLRPVL